MPSTRCSADRSRGGPVAPGRFDEHGHALPSWLDQLQADRGLLRRTINGLEARRRAAEARVAQLEAEAGGLTAVRPPRSPGRRQGLNAERNDAWLALFHYFGMLEWKAGRTPRVVRICKKVAERWAREETKRLGKPGRLYAPSTVRDGVEEAIPRFVDSVIAERHSPHPDSSKPRE